MSEPMHLIGQEWIEHGYQTFGYQDDVDPCVIDGTPNNTCTGEVEEDGSQEQPQSSD